jgi:hypothetical protein
MPNPTLSKVLRLGSANVAKTASTITVTNTAPIAARILSLFMLFKIKELELKV